jgi:uncharacterized protein
MRTKTKASRRDKPKPKAAFWDTSALVPLCLRQDETTRAQQLSRQYGKIIVWWGTSVEAYSSLNRLFQEGEIDEPGLEQAISRLDLLRTSWSEILPTEQLRELAESMPQKYNLRALDSLQLAAAFVWCNERPQKRPFICFDTRLSQAATLAGFAAIPKL